MKKYQSGKHAKIGVNRINGADFLTLGESGRIFSREIGSDQLKTATLFAYGDEARTLFDGKTVVRKNNVITII